MTEKPREKIIRFGPDGLKNHELLALILKTGYKGKPVFELAKELLEKYPDLIELPYRELVKIKGIGTTKSAAIVAARELVNRTASAKSNRLSKITNPADILPYVAEIRDRKKECFVVLYLNARNEVINKEFVSIGTLDTSIVHPREVFSPAVEKRAAYVILTHNHPSGDCNPSENDRQITKKLVKCGDILGIEIMDHVIMAKNNYYSFKENCPEYLVLEESVDQFMNDKE